MATAIEVSQLSVRYGDNLILDQIDFEVGKGEVFVILGGSGCGKTTLLRHMIGLEYPRQGKVMLQGHNIHSPQAKQRQAALQSIGVMFQSGALFGSLSLSENIAVPLQESTTLSAAMREKIALAKLKMVGLNGFAHRLPFHLSGGMQKRAAIARAMALDPAIIFLDEPSAGLDPITSRELDQLIIELSRSLNITFVVVTHELRSIEAIADRAIILNNKKILAQGTVTELKQRTENTFIKQFFFQSKGINKQ
jgi:phospholipid/cholesterol/gamma-HCH transport system ATP-binding protein